MGIFDKRVRCKPYEYDHLMSVRDAITDSRWHAEEYLAEISNDVQEYNTILTEEEKSLVKNAMLAISQIEVESVKMFWSKIGDWLPKPEVSMVGSTLAENEVTHFESYSLLLEKLGLNDEFEKLLQNDVIQDRVNYLTKYLKGSGDNVKEFRVLQLVLFALLVENTSLFGQFYVLKSFRKNKNLLKGIDSIVLATQQDEMVHALFGVELISIIKDENPEWFNDDFYQKIYRACKKAYDAEENIIDWMFEKGDLPFISASEVKEFIKHRINVSLEMMGGLPIFNPHQETLDKTKWFDIESSGYVRNDFFNTKSRNYNKKTVTTNDIRGAIKRINEMV